MAIDYPYTASTCDVMYWRHRRHLYYGGEHLKYFLTPLSRISSFLGGQRWQPIQMEHRLLTRGRAGRGGLDTLLMPMVPACAAESASIGIRDYAQNWEVKTTV
jgi:hypothetical protein